MHLICPPEFCIPFVFIPPRELQPSQEKLKTVFMPIVFFFWGGGEGGGAIRCIMGDVQVASEERYKKIFINRFLTPEEPVGN